MANPADLWIGGSTKTWSYYCLRQLAIIRAAFQNNNSNDREFQRKPERTTRPVSRL